MVLIMEDSKDIENIDSEIEKLKIEKKKLKQAQDKKLRLRSNNSGKSNVLMRVSINFKNDLDKMNKEREENGLDCLSYPKQTELIRGHKKYWKPIEKDITHYNTNLDGDEEEFNEK